MEREGLTIQQLSTRTGVNPRTIHYYVSRGLLPGAGKQGPRTRYPERVLEMVLEIRRLQTESELTLREIRRRFVEEGKVPARRPKPRTTKQPAVRGHSSDVMPSAHDYENENGHGHQTGNGHSNGNGDGNGNGGPRTLAGSDLVREKNGRAAHAALLDALDESAPEAGSGEAIPAGAAPDRLLAALKSLVGDRAVPSSGSGDRWVAIPITQDLLLAARRLRPEELRSLQRAADYLRRILLDTKA